MSPSARPLAVVLGALLAAGVASSAAAAPSPSTTSAAAPSAVAAHVDGEQQDVGTITYTLHRSATPSDDERDAYARITAAMDEAVARYNSGIPVNRHMNVHYNPGIPTAEASIDGYIGFGANRSFMNHYTAMHELSHTLGVGTSGSWACHDGTYTGRQATDLVRSYGDAGLSCGGAHFWPYGLNYHDEYTELNAQRHVEVVAAMLRDGM